MAFDAFLKLDGIKGESADAKHKDEIQIESYSWGVANTGTTSGGGGGGAGRAIVQDFTFTSDISKAMPPLFTHCASGKHIKEGLLTLRKAGGDQFDFLKIKFSDILITGLSEAGNADGTVPMDQVSLNFGEIEIEYIPQEQDGSAGDPVRATWNVRENRT
jgi:type VI secretion system secreted protein Hcp